MLHTDPAAYFTARAATYQDIYQRPESREELLVLHDKVADLMDGHAVLEVGCGTGYWTRLIADAAASITAVDNNPAMLAVARETSAEEGIEGIEWVEGDAYDLPASDQYTACFGGFWWSHLPRQHQDTWLNGLQKKLGKDTLLVLIDNTYVEGSSTPIAHTDAEGNTYQIRTLAGERYDILKNFPTDSALRKRFAAHAREIRVSRSDHFWMLSCRLK